MAKSAIKTEAVTFLVAAPLTIVPFLRLKVDNEQLGKYSFNKRKDDTTYYMVIPSIKLHALLFGEEIPRYDSHFPEAM